MAINLTTIKKSGITTLTIKKESQVYSSGRTQFLANQIKNPAHICWQTSYPPTSDPTRILPVGTTLQVLGVYPGNTRYAPAYITVHSSTGFTFDIMAPDISRFCV